MDDLFGGMFKNINLPEKKEEKAADNAKAKKEKKPKKTEKKGYVLPVTVYSDYFEPIVIRGDISSLEMTENEILKEVTADKPFLKNFTLEVLDEKRFVLVRPEYGDVKKGMVTVNDELEIVMGDKNIDISSITDGLNEISYEKISEYLKVQTGTEVDLFKDGDRINVLFGTGNGGRIENLKFPFSVILGIDGVHTVEKEDYLKALKKNLPEEAEEEDEEAGAEDGMLEEISDDEAGDSQDEEDVKITSNDLIRYIETLDDTYKGGHCRLYVNSDKNINCVRVTYKKKFVAPAAKKEELFPTNAVVSLIYERHQLTPEMFGGKEEVASDEIQKFLEKMYPEFSKERTYLEYDKKNNIIIPMIKSSKRGALSFADEEGIKYRISDTPFAYIKASTDGNGFGEFAFRLPKLPYYVYEGIRDFFGRVYEKYSSEAAVLLLWNPASEKYVIYVPKQKVSSGSVEFEISPQVQSGYWRIGTIHSHGAFNAFFSSEDDINETGEGIYGVIGRFDSSEQDFVLRAGTGGNFIGLSLEDIFDVCDSSGKLKLWRKDNIAKIRMA